MEAKRKSFALGYSLVIHAIIAWVVNACWTTGSLNVLVPTFNAVFGWDRAQMMTFASVGLWVGIIGSILFARLIQIKGARLISAITIVLTGLVVILLGNGTSLIIFAVSLSLIQILTHGYSFIGSNTIIGNWYPVRKGFVLGITTMGMPLSSLAVIPILNSSVNSLGHAPAISIIGVLVIVFGVITWFWVRNTPQEVGLLPDNGKYPDKIQAGPSAGESIWSFAKLIKNKNAICLAVAYGLLFLVTQGFISQTVPYCMEQGFTQPNAVGMLSLAAGIGMAGSFIWGVVDDRIGTKKASVIYCIFYAITFVVLYFPVNTGVVILGVVMFGSSLGGIGNLMPSMVITTFGPAEFASVSRVTNTLCTVVRGFAYVVMAIGLRLDGTYQSSMIPLAVLSVLALVLIALIDKKNAPKLESVGA